jgi:hypothetical protein
MVNFPSASVKVTVFAVADYLNFIGFVKVDLPLNTFFALVLAQFDKI